MYSEFDGRCELNKADHEATPKALTRIDWIDYYQRTCYGETLSIQIILVNIEKPSVAILRDDSQFQDHCFDTIPGKVGRIV